MRTVLELVEVSYLLVVVTSGPYPSGVLAEASQVVASDLLETSGHVGHELEWGELLDVQPLTIFVVIHDPHELILILGPLSAIKRGNLAGINNTPTYGPGPSSNLRV